MHSAVPAQVMANKLIDFDPVAKHSPVHIEKYAATLFIFIKKLENRLQGCWKKMVQKIKISSVTLYTLTTFKV